MLKPEVLYVASVPLPNLFAVLLLPDLSFSPDNNWLFITVEEEISVASYQICNPVILVGVKLPPPPGKRIYRRYCTITYKWHPCILYNNLNNISYNIEYIAKYQPFFGEHLWCGLASLAQRGPKVRAFLRTRYSWFSRCCQRYKCNSIESDKLFYIILLYII